MLGVGEDDWYVVQVDRRTEERVGIDDRRELLVGKLRQHLPLANQLESLREKGEVSFYIDVFEEWLGEDGLN